MAERMAPAVTDTLKDLLGDGRYADLTITCAERQWRVHKNIVCTRCAFFEKAVDGRFAESKTNAVDLKENHPNAVAAMIRFLYTDDFDDTAHAAENDGEWKQLAMTVQVYMVGDQFGLKRLTDLAKAKFEACLGTHAHTAPGFLEAIRLTFSEDVELLTPFRARLIECVLKHGMDLFSNGEFQEFAASVPQFAAVLLKEKFRLDKEEDEKKPVIEAWQHRVYACPTYGCRLQFAVKWQLPGDQVKCPNCSAARTALSWSQFSRGPAHS